jgi:hypothetical protein
MERNTIAVIGGTGKAGKYIVNELLSKGYKVKLLARNPEKIDFISDHLEIIKGDATDFRSLGQLLENCNTLISSLGARKTDDKETDYKATVEIVRALKNARVTRYIFVTGFIIDTINDRKGFKSKLLSMIMKMMFPVVIRSKQMSFDLLNKTDIRYTMVRIPFLDLRKENGKLEICLDDVRGSKVAAQSLATFVVSLIENEEFIRKSPFVSSI